MSAEYKQDPERVAYLLRCERLNLAIPSGAHAAVYVVDYSNKGALYTFTFSNLTSENLDATSPDDAAEIVREWQPTARAKHDATAAALATAIHERDLARAKMMDEHDLAAKDIAMWKDEAQAMGRAARRWTFYCAFAMLGGVIAGFWLARLV